MKPRSSLLVVILAVVGAIGFAPAAAQAAQRYVSPSGTGSTCTSAAPCSLSTGVGSAGANDEVIVGAGTYNETSTITPGAAGLTIHGTPGARPVINTTGFYGLEITKADVTVRDLTIDHSSNFYALYVVATGSTFERVTVKESHSSASACVLSKAATIRDSACEGAGSSNHSLWLTDADGTTRLRNVDVIGDGSNSDGLLASVSASGINTVVDGRNLIIDGPFRDVTAFTAAGSTVTVTLASSNYNTDQGGAGATITPHGTNGNQTDLPIFTAGFKEAPGSPTIDAGTTDAYTSSTDLDGIARVQGPAVDIGATEVAVATPTDTTPPHTTLQTGPKQKSKSKTAEFTFVSDEPGSIFKCSVDSKPAAPCTSPLTVSHLKKGSHTFSVAATDGSGNTDASPSTYAWKVAKKHKKHHHKGGHS